MRIIVGIFLFAIAFPVDEQEEIGFQYGILGRLNSQNKQITELQDSTKIYSGDEIRINAGYKKDTHFYVIYKGSEGEFDILYPDLGKMVVDVEEQPDTIYSTVLYWSQLTDPAGIETFFLINSSFKLESLTAMFTRYNKVNAKGRMKLAKKIQMELDDLNPETKLELASLGNRLDKPIVGGVAFRGDDGEILKDMSLTHSCTGSLGIAFRKLIINHQ